MLHGNQDAQMEYDSNFTRSSDRPSHSEIKTDEIIVRRGRHGQGVHQVIYKETKRYDKIRVPKMPKRVYLKDLFYMQHDKRNEIYRQRQGK